MWHRHYRSYDYFRNGRGVYSDGQSSYSPRCQEAREEGRLPMTDATRELRRLARDEGLKLSVAAAQAALKASWGGEKHHVSKYGRRVAYYDPMEAADEIRIKFHHGRLELA